MQPIAIIGCSCRLPGASNPDAFWRLLREGVSAISRIPADRRQLEQSILANELEPGARWGGFLEEIDRFGSRLLRHLTEGGGGDCRADLRRDHDPGRDEQAHHALAALGLAPA